jgi:hypothetical protein
VRLAAAALLLALAACGASRDPAPPEDEVLGRLATSAHRALELDQPASAAGLYERALARARERDDPVAIADMAFGQATAALAAGDAAAAQRIAQQVREDLNRRNRAATPGLVLVEAAALHRLGRAAEAEPLARQVVLRAPESPAAALRARFLLGLVAASRGDLAGVTAQEAALAGSADPAFQADAVELAARAALLRGNAQRAADEAAAAALLRQQALDYRGLSRALALEGAARAALGDAPRAADLYLRAGQGAAQRGERADARRWLAEASRLARAAGRPAIVAAVRRSEADLRRD